MARELAPAGLRSGPKIPGALRTPAGASSLATLGCLTIGCLHIGLFVVRENASRWCVFCVVYPCRGGRNVLLKRGSQRKRLRHPLNRLVDRVFPACLSRKAAGQSGLRRAFSAVPPVLGPGGQTGPWGRQGPAPVPVRCPRPAPWPRPVRNAGRSSLRWQNLPSRTG